MWFGPKRNEWGETKPQEFERRLKAVEALAQECARRDNQDDNRWVIHDALIRSIQRKQMGLPDLETIEPPPDQETLPDILSDDA